ncbi:sulfite exporter TauE/SafE family protein [Aliivibrio kagoshimensis]|uniref:sulfite exporter TauE/SafE family protein n=1 Tax=Aliivibrio kagoshimensis TaxID=2910230 RepID=UPI003D12748E
MALIFLGSFIQSSIGFGLAIVAAPILYQISPDYVPAPITIVALFLSIINAYKNRSNISLDGLWMAIVGRVPGTLAGGALLLFIDTKTLSLWLGSTVLIAVAISLLPVRIAPTPKKMMVAGFFSGFMGTSSGIGGPPMALLLQHQEGNLVRANLSAFFVVSSVLSLLVQAPIGYMTMYHFMLSLPLLPASLLGYVVAMFYVDRLSKEKIRIASLLICSLSGLTAILTVLI